ncbi:MAG TPA: EamA family transporter [Bdellovibrionota bacterium]|nr:EamA family transporter [Bdellovibrionota bacterium]
MMNRGPFLALLSAALFGISPVLIKIMIGEVPPLLMAGLLYIGSGIGLLGLGFALRKPILAPLKNLNPRQQKRLIGAIISGGIVAPVCLTMGISYGSAFEVSALLNLETVATTFIAWLVFHEHVGRRVWIGKALVVAGAVIVSVQFSSSRVSLAALWILSACLFWGIDNNLTRDIEDLPPIVLAGVKGLGAGIFNTTLGWMFGGTAALGWRLAGVLGIGAVSFGLSLVLFVQALRIIGSARTSTYFASGPFMGMVLSVLLLGDHPATYQWMASLLMAAGVWALYRERHEHGHTHESAGHSHRHVRDEHHQHEHDGTEGPEPHEHFHVHQPLTHSHPHLPDIHHRHRH